MSAEWSRGESSPEALFGFEPKSVPEPKRLEEFVAEFFADVEAFEARFASWSLDNGAAAGSLPARHPSASWAWCSTGGKTTFSLVRSRP